MLIILHQAEYLSLLIIIKIPEYNCQICRVGFIDEFDEVRLGMPA